MKRIIALCLLTTGLATSTLASANPTAASAPAGLRSVDLGARDLRVAPGDDFYLYANGTWLANAVIPAGSFAISPATDARKQTRENIRRLVERAAADPADKSRVAALYRSYMDVDAIEKRGAAPLQSLLKGIDGAKNRDALAVLAGRSYYGVEAAPIMLLLAPGAEDSSRYGIALRLSAIGLPGQRYYSDEKLASTKQAYRDYAEKMLSLAGRKDAAAMADAIVALESRIAAADWSPTQYRDRNKIHNVMTVADLQKQAPGFPWAKFLAGAGLGKLQAIDVAAPPPTAAFAKIWSETPLPVLKAWIAFKTADEAATFLPKRFQEAQADFRLGVLRGQSDRDPRWLSGVGVLNSLISADMSRLYVQTYLTPEVKAAVTEIAENVRKAFSARIARADWMSAATKQEAQKKLAAMSLEIGSPDKLEDYGALSMKDGDLFANALTGFAYKWSSRVKEVGQPVDKHRWTVPPQFSGAFYDGSLNLIGVTTGSLQPPSFDINADPALNYAAIGMVIGHEISHGFDDQGRKLDADGNLRDWWTPEDAARFQAEAKKLADYYSEYEPLPGIHVNGSLVLGEALADLGGTIAALDAYHLSLKGKPAPVIDGLTGDQRFFLAFAQAWRSKEAESWMKSTLLTDPHSPPSVRVQETVRNVNDWYAAFDVKPGQKEYRAPGGRVHIW